LNIFVLSSNLTKNAQYHTNKHLVKMITEQTQLLCSAYYFTPTIPEDIYKLYNPNHPAAKWARASLQNWLWLKQSTLALLNEYAFRYGKQHKTALLIEKLPNPELPNKKRTPFAQVVLTVYRCNNAIVAYRSYYVNEKQHTFAWKNRPVPPFVKRHLKKLKQAVKQL